jgi:hypothetical protein
MPESAGVTKNSKSQISNIKWFDKLTTLSLVEGQITMTKIVGFSVQVSASMVTFPDT